MNNVNFITGTFTEIAGHRFEVRPDQAEYTRAALAAMPRCQKILRDYGREVVLFNATSETLLGALVPSREGSPLVAINLAKLDQVVAGRSTTGPAARLTHGEAMDLATAALLAHELVHLDQHNSGRLVQIDGIHVIWEGVECLSAQAPGYDPKGVMPPWEVEAVQAEARIIGEAFNVDPEIVARHNIAAWLASFNKVA